METERRRNIYLSKENAESPMLKALITQNRFSSVVNELLANYLSTGQIGENSIIVSLEEEIRQLNSVIEVLTLLLEKTYRASVYSAGMAYEVSDPEICNRVADRAQGAYMNIVEGDYTESDEFFMLPKPIQRSNSVRNREQTSRGYNEPVAYSRKQSSEYTQSPEVELPRTFLSRTPSGRNQEVYQQEMNNPDVNYERNPSRVLPKEMTQEEIARRRFAIKQQEDLGSAEPPMTSPAEVPQPEMKQPEVIHASLADVIRLGNQNKGGNQ